MPRHLGLSGAGFSTPDHLGLERSGLLQQGPGAVLYLFGSGAPNRLTVGFSFATASPALDRCSRDEQENAVRTAFSGFGGEAPRLLEAMSEADDFCFSEELRPYVTRNQAAGRHADLTGS